MADSRQGLAPPSRNRLARAERTEQLREIAYREFARLGYDAVSMAAIAELAGVTKPIVYSHFESKDGLYSACTDQLVEPMLERVEHAARAAETPDGQLWAGILAQLEFIAEHRAEWRVYVRDAATRGGTPGIALAQGRRRVTALLADLIELASETAGAPPPPEMERDAFAHALQGAVEQVASWWETYPEEAAEAVALRVMNFAWVGFGGMTEGRYWVPPEY